MAVTMIDVMVVMIAFTICFVIAELFKAHVRKHCENNPEIIWIWLDDDDEPQGGHRVKSDRTEKRLSLNLGPVPCINGI